MRSTTLIAEPARANEPVPSTTAGIVPELLTTLEAAELCSIGERSIWRWSRSGAAPRPVRIGGAVRYRRAELLAWIEAGCPRVDKRHSKDEAKAAACGQGLEIFSTVAGIDSTLPGRRYLQAIVDLLNSIRQHNQSQKGFSMAARNVVIPSEQIEQAILIIRGQKVMLDADLAKLYGVTTKRLNEQVRRNRARFPADFMFQLSVVEATALRSQMATLDQGGRQKHRYDEAANLRSQIATSKPAHGGRRYRPYAFTEQGVAMLSSVLHSPQAVRVNIEIMRAFVRLRHVLALSAELAKRLDEIEERVGNHDELFLQVIREIKHLSELPPDTQKPRIGFYTGSDKKSSTTPQARRKRG